MATSYTDNLKLALPANGELDGQWGTTVNDNITKMIEEAITGVASLSTWVANAMTITTTNGTTASGRCMMLDLSGTLSATGTLTVPTAKKFYLVRNGTTGGYGVTVTMASGTTVTVPNGETMGVFTDGTNTKEAITYVSEALFAASATTATSATSATSATTATTAENLKSNATTGKIQITGPGVGTTRVITVPDADTTMLTTTNTVTVAQGGTGVASLTANNVIIGNGTNAVQFVAPGTSGNLLTSNGTTWTSTAPAAISGLTVSQGGTGAATFTAKSLLVGNGTDAIQELPLGSADHVVFVDGSTWGTVNVHALLDPRTSNNGVTTSGDITPVFEDIEQYDIIGLTGTSAIKKPTGGQNHAVSKTLTIKDDGSARTLSWETGVSNGYRAVNVTLPTTTVAGKIMYVGCKYNSTDSRWDVLAIAQEA